ncbi:hypothetical protein CDD81_248 [Ophiocordyceps australis]|uniref:Beta/gamma crystallin 'Greek key' domain-containing protein n=1 Tax=Ophiocordyceps australis TaxID=1399860 RepID=A0A2C5Y9L0_9HYPO|nr:hypothetical protein CDD81_248 [Ophiocordyceps australis]
MHITKVLALAFASSALAADTAASYLGIAYSQPQYRGYSQTIGNHEAGRCVNLDRGVRNDVESVRVSRGVRCTYWNDQYCRGHSDSYQQDDGYVRGKKYDSVRCEYWRR